jgi:hypothetical protein
VALTGLTTAATNEFAEVILGGSIAIPIAFAFFGAAATVEIAQAGAFDLGFRAMPQIFLKIPGGEFFGTLWFLLLFFAGATSSVALTQPMVSFLQDEFGFTRRRAVVFVWVFIFLAAHLCILNGNFLDEMDNWAGTIGVVIFATLEVLLFCYLFGMKKGWHEITLGADIQLPGFFRYIIWGVTPAYLVFLVVMVSLHGGGEIVKMQDLRDGLAQRAIVQVLTAEKLKPGPATLVLVKRDLSVVPRDDVKRALMADGVPGATAAKVEAALGPEIESFHSAVKWRWVARYFMIGCFLGLILLTGLAWRQKRRTA